MWFLINKCVNEYLTAEPVDQIIVYCINCPVHSIDINLKS